MSVVSVLYPLILFVVFFIPAMGSIVLQCIGQYALMKNRGMERPWLGAIPVVNLYVLGLLGDNIQYYRGRRTTYRYWMVAYLITYPVMMLVSTLVTILSVSSIFRGNAAPMHIMALLIMLGGMVLCYIGLILSYVCFYRIFQEYIPRDATFFTCMAIFFGLGGALVFAIRNWPPVTAGAPFVAPARPPANPAPRY